MGQRIKLFVMDVDGTLTDGSINMSEGGEIFKSFNVKDGYGIKCLLPSYGIKPVIITGRESRIVEERAKDLCIDFIFQGVNDKKKVLLELTKTFHYECSEVAYVGDDLNDLECIKMVGFSACPHDACNKVKEIVDYVASANGGKGAVREVIEYIVSL